MSETEWDTKMIIPVSFAQLILPSSVETEAKFRLENGGATGHLFAREAKRQPTDLIELRLYFVSLAKIFFFFNYSGGCVVQLSIIFKIFWSISILI